MKAGRYDYWVTGNEMQLKTTKSGRESTLLWGANGRGLHHTTRGVFRAAYRIFTDEQRDATAVQTHHTTWRGTWKECESGGDKLKTRPYDVSAIAGHSPQTGWDASWQKDFEPPWKVTLGIAELDSGANVAQEGVFGIAREDMMADDSGMIMNWLQASRTHSANTMDELGPTD